MKNPLETLVEIYGNKNRIAKAFKMDNQVVQAWIRKVLSVEPRERGRGSYRRKGDCLGGLGMGS